MATEKRLIDANALIKKARWMEEPDGNGINCDILAVSVCAIEDAPTVDAVEVVFCDYCVKHGGCYTEDVFRLARIEKPYCCAGKKDGERNA